MTCLCLPQICDIKIHLNILHSILKHFVSCQPVLFLLLPPHPCPKHFQGFCFSQTISFSFPNPCSCQFLLYISSIYHCTPSAPHDSYFFLIFWMQVYCMSLLLIVLMLSAWASCDILVLLLCKPVSYYIVTKLLFLNFFLFFGGGGWGGGCSVLFLNTFVSIFYLCFCRSLLFITLIKSWYSCLC